MSYLNKVVYLSEEQKNTLFANNTITVNNTTVTYNSDDLYIVPDEIDTSPIANSTNLVTSGGVYNAIHNYVPPLAGTATKLSTEGTAAKFWRGDNTWSDTISGGTLKITNNNNTITIGSQNGDYAHVYSSSKPFIFNKTVSSTDGDLGNSSYRWKKLFVNNIDAATSALIKNISISENTISSGTTLYLNRTGSASIIFTKNGASTSNVNGWFDINGNFILSNTWNTSISGYKLYVDGKSYFNDTVTLAEDLKFTKDSKSASIVFNSTTNALDFVFA